MNHDHITRPLDCLNSWLEHYGYDKNRRSTDSDLVLTYALAREKGADGLWRNRWIMGGAASDPAQSFKDLFSEIVTIYKKCRDAEKKEATTRILSILVMTQGEGRWGIGAPDENAINETWNALSPEQQQEARDNDPEFFKKFDMGTIPVRIVNAISETGLIAEITMFPPDLPPEIEIMEQWSESESANDIQTRGNIDEVLHQTFAFLQLIEASVIENEEPTIDGLGRTAMRLAQEGDTQLMSFLFRMMASGLDNGLFEFGEE